jgi:hypothetical protein
MEKRARMDRDSVFCSKYSFLNEGFFRPVTCFLLFDQIPDTDVISSGLSD